MKLFSTPIPIRKVFRLSEKVSDKSLIPSKYHLKSYPKSYPKSQTASFLPKNAEEAMMINCLIGIQRVLTERKIPAKLAGRPIRGSRHLQILLSLARSTDLKKMVSPEAWEAFAFCSGAVAVITRRELNQLAIEFELPRQYHQLVTFDQISGLGIGIDVKRQPIEIQFPDEAPQVVVIGTTGSGKSETLRTITLALMRAYSPVETRFILIDPHQDMADFDYAAHLLYPRAVNIDTILKTLEAAVALYEQRRTNNVRDSYRIIIVIDEATELCEMYPELNEPIARLVNGRKFKINVVMGAHQVTEKGMPGIGRKAANRFIGKVVNANASYHASNLPELAAHKLAGRGDFYHVVGDRVKRIQIAKPSPDDFMMLERTETPSLLKTQTAVILPAEKQAGRPTVNVDPVKVASYLTNDVSRKIARESLGLGYDLHKRHEVFANTLTDALEDLQYCLERC